MKGSGLADVACCGGPIVVHGMDVKPLSRKMNAFGALVILVLTGITLLPGAAASPCDEDPASLECILYTLCSGSSCYVCPSFQEGLGGGLPDVPGMVEALVNHQIVSVPGVGWDGMFDDTPMPPGGPRPGWFVLDFDPLGGGVC